MAAPWTEAGEIDLLDWFAELTIYTSSACLIGTKFRRQLDGRFAALYHDLERGTDALAFVDPYAPIDSFRRRDAARAGLVGFGRGNHGGQGGFAAREPAKSGTCSTYSCPCGGRSTARPCSPPTRSPACSSR